jgi:hypothetical protein
MQTVTLHETGCLQQVCSVCVLPVPAGVTAFRVRGIEIERGGGHISRNVDCF